MDQEKRGKNPYRWDLRDPGRFISRRALIGEALSMCEPGKGGALLLLGTRGMGKSTFLARLRDELVKEPTNDVILIDGPPLARGQYLGGDEMLGALSNRLLDRLTEHSVGDDEELRKELGKLAQRGAPRPLLSAYLDAVESRFDRLVLLYDELDRYADEGRGAKDFFSALEDARQQLQDRVAIVAAGGLDMLSLKTVLGSTLYVRATRRVLDSFGDEEIAELSGDYERRGTPLTDDVLATLRVLSGGNAALVTYGLESLWKIDQPTPLHIHQAFERFTDDHADFGDSVRRALFEYHASEIPIRVWRRLKQTGGRLAKSELDGLRKIGPDPVPPTIGSKDILDMLRASGFIRMNDAGWRSDPIVAEIIPSILTLDVSLAAATCETLADQLRADLVEAMADIHRMTTSFYRTDTNKGGGKHILPESAFAAAIAVSLSARGWKTDLEAASGAGYSDIKARYPARFGEDEIIIEVKHWDNGDVATIHGQVVSYGAKGVVAFATVVITDHKDPHWSTAFEDKCLTGKIDGDPTWKVLDAPLLGYFEARTGSFLVEHFLLRLASR